MIICPFDKSFCNRPECKDDGLFIICVKWAPDRIDIIDRKQDKILQSIVNLKNKVE